MITPYLFKYVVHSSRLRRAYYNTIKNKDIFVRTKMDMSGLRVTLNIGDFVQFWMFMEGYEQELCRFMSEKINGGIFLDIGANVGAYTLSLCRKASRIYAFEASKNTCEILQSSLDLNSIDNVTVVNRAAYNESGRIMRLNLSPETLGSNSVFQNGGDQWEEVETITIDQYVLENGIENITAMKVDVEGADFLAMMGASETIKKNRPVLLCEFFCGWAERAGFNLESYFDYLMGFGYDAFTLKKGKLERFSRARLSESGFNENMIFRMNDH
jgi:FkbM family methyltransferase